MTDQNFEPNGPRVLYTIEQAAEQLGISRTTMFSLIKTGEIETIAIGRLRRIPADEIAAYIAHKMSDDPNKPRRGRPPKPKTAPSVLPTQSALPEQATEPEEKPAKKKTPRRKRVEGTRAPNGAGSVYLGRDGLWHVRVTVGTKDDGSPDRRHRTAKSETEAYDKLQELTSDVRTGSVRKAGRVPLVEELLTRWLEEIAPITAGYNTMKGHRTNVNKYLIPGVGKHRADRVEAEHFEKLYAKILKSGIGAHTPNAVHRTARAAFNEFVRRGWLQRNVVAFAKPPRLPKSEVEPLEIEDMARIFDAALRRRNGVRYVMALAMGNRQGEALGMKWKRLDRKKRSVKVAKQIQRHSYRHGCADAVRCAAAWHKTEPCPKGCTLHKRECPPPCKPGCAGHARHCPDRIGGLVEVDVKSEAGKREQALPDRLWDMLMEHEQAQAAEREHAGTAWQEGGWMFTQVDGRPIDSKADRAEWYDVLAEAGVDPRRLHDARHAAATVLVLLEVATRVAMDQMGWSTPEMMARYGHVTDRMRRSLADRIGALLFDGFGAENGSSETSEDGAQDGANDPN